MNKAGYNKVICIGFQKTGTTTLGVALTDLGFTVLGARTDLAIALLNGDITTVLKVAEPYDALQDNPWALLYKELDLAYPHSKFILLERNEEQWISSVVNHFGTDYTDMRKWIYGHGVALGNEQIYLKKYREHNKAVKSYFKDRPADLLIMSLKNDASWDKLCDFLKIDVPDKNFPFENKAKHRWSLWERVYNKLRSFFPVRLRRGILDLFGIKDKRNRFHNQQENQTYRKNQKLD